MVMSIQNNFAAISIFRNLQNANVDMGKSVEKLSSGMRINVAADGPADLVESERLRAQIESMEQSIRDTVTTKDLLAITEGALGEVQKILRDMKSLALHAANSGITSPEQVAADQAQMDVALQAIDRILGSTGMAGQKILGNITPKGAISANKNTPIPTPETTTGATASGTAENNDATALPSTAAEGDKSAAAAASGGGTLASPTLTAASGGLSAETGGEFLPQLSKKEREILDLSKKLIDMGSTAGLGMIDRLDSDGLAVGGGLSLHDLYSGGAASLEADPEAAMNIIEQASKDVAASRAGIGAQRNGLDSIEEYERGALENITKMESDIRDTDMATEITQFAKSQILSQVGTQLLHTANEQWRNIETLVTQNLNQNPS